MNKIFLHIILVAMLSNAADAQTVGSYAIVTGLRMYYEVHGTGYPLVLIHGGGSTIQTTFGRVLPQLASQHQVIAVELQAHGHSADRGVPTSFKQDADDVAELLRQLHIAKADILGFSNGGQTALEIALRHPALVHKLVFASMFYKKTGVPEIFWAGMKQAKFSDLPQVYKDEFLKVNPDSGALMTMFTRDAYRMQHFEDWSEAQIRSVQAPVFLVISNQDVPTPEHAVEMSRLLPHNQLVILPGGHGGYLGEMAAGDPQSRVPDLFVAMLEEFMSAGDTSTHQAGGGSS